MLISNAKNWNKSSFYDENFDDYEDINKEISRVITEMKIKENFDCFQNIKNTKTYINNHKFVDEKMNFSNSYQNLNNFNKTYFIPLNYRIQKLNDNIFFNNNVNNNFSLDNNNNKNIENSKNNNNNNKNKNNKNKKTKIKKHLDSSKNLIHLDNVIKLIDKRKTLIIRNIPNKYTMKLLLEEINLHFYGKYDIIYLPLDFEKGKNLGYGFINFIDPIHIMYFYDEFIGKKWNNFNSEKKCQLAYAKIQGKNEILKYIYKKNNMNMINRYRNNNNNNIFYIENTQIICNEIEIPLKYYVSFINYYPYSLCHKKNDSVFVVDKYFQI